MQVKVLIVDDDDYMVRLYRRLFEYEDFVVFVAQDGQAAIELVNELQPNLIMLDIMMPVMNGLEALEILKGAKLTKEIPIVMLTNLNDAANIEKAKALGADDYLLKSNFEGDYIMGVVRKYIPSPAPLPLIGR